MKGRILDIGVISGEDGKRYEFSLVDILNQADLLPSQIIGLNVDFVANEGKATQIYLLTNDNKEFSKSFKNQDSELFQIKIFYIIGILISGFYFLDLGFFSSFVAFVLEIIAIYKVKNLTKSKTILKNFVVQAIIPSLAFIVIGSFGFMALFEQTISIIGLLIGGGLFLASLVYMYKFYDELSKLTNEDLFFYVFVCKFLRIFALFIGLGWLVYLLALSLEILAWLKTKEFSR